MPISYQSVGLAGLERVVARLNREILNIEGRTLKGLIKCAKMIQQETLTVPPTTPKDTGNLRNSWFTFPGRLSNGNPFIIMGYSGAKAPYAIYVHEMIGANFKEPGSGAKWFQSALWRNKDRIMRIIQENARIR